MKRLWFLGFVASLAGLLGPIGQSRAATPLTADEVIRRTVERADPATASNVVAKPDYKYQKRTVTEEIDTKGKLKDRKEKLYEVSLESGLSYFKLLQINGQGLTPKELKKQEDKEAAERAKWMDTKSPQKGDKWENFLTAELVARYKFTLLETRMMNERTTYVLKFEPKSDNLPVKKLTDRFLNHVGGKVFIDAEDFEITRADVHLNAEISLWGGIVGTLRRCDYTLVRTRMPDGVWMNSSSHGVFEGRKLLEQMFIRTNSESTDFRKLAMAN